jgi:hypothetical protein
MYRPEEPFGILYVMQGQRAVGEIEVGLLQIEPLEVGSLISDQAVRSGGPRTGKHLFGQVEASEREIDYTASVEGICIPAKWVESAKRIADLLDKAGTPLEPGTVGIAGLDVGAGKGKSVYVSRFGPVVTVPIAWGNPDITETALNALEHAREDKLGMLPNGLPRSVARLRFDEVGVGKGVLSTLTKFAGRGKGPQAVAINVGVQPSATVWPDGKTSLERFGNLKAELWFLCRERFKATHEMVLHLAGENLAPGRYCGHRRPGYGLADLAREVVS